MIDRSKIISQSKKAFEIADFTKSLTYRIVATAAKKLIDHGYRRADSTHKHGFDFHFSQTDAVKDTTTYVNNEMERMVSDLLGDVEAISVKIAKDQIAKIPREKWDKEEFLGLLLFGDTFRQRSVRYTKKLKEELEAYVRVGQSEDMNNAEVVRWYLDNMEEPQKDELIIAAIGAGYLEMNGLSAFRSFAYLTNDMVTRGFHTANAFYWRYAKAKQIIAMRDSHTCQTCQDLDGRILPIEEMVLPVHGSCRCIEIPII